MLWSVDPHGFDPIEGSEFDCWWTPDMMPEWEVKKAEWLKRRQRLAKQKEVSSGGKPYFNLASEDEWPSL